MIFQVCRQPEEKKPPNIRAYVEKQLKEKEYDKKLSEVERHIWNLSPGQDEKYDKYENDLNQILREAEREVPGYSESRGRQISEIHGDLRAFRTKGKSGSTRMVQRLTFAQIAKEEFEKEKKSKKRTPKKK